MYWDPDEIERGFKLLGCAIFVVGAIAGVCAFVLFRLVL